MNEINSPPQQRRRGNNSQDIIENQDENKDNHNVRRRKERKTKTNEEKIELIMTKLKIKMVKSALCIYIKIADDYQSWHCYLCKRHNKKNCGLTRCNTVDVRAMWTHLKSDVHRKL